MGFVKKLINASTGWNMKYIFSFGINFARVI